MANTATCRHVRALPAATIFLGSFLAFCMQPMVARTLLPHFGGGAAVWVTCLAAFQAMLLAGYWYAHWRLSHAEAQGRGEGSGCAEHAVGNGFRWHLAMLVAAAGWMGIVAACGGRIAGAVSGMCAIPALGVLLAVLALAGVAYVLLSANASLVQVLAGGEYRLYAVSNLGSFAGLFAHPLGLEPFVGVSAQWWLMAALMLVYAGMLWRCGVDCGFISCGGAESQEGFDGNGATLPTGNSHLETLNLKLETLNLKLETLNSKPETLNPKPETLNSKLHPVLWLALPAAGCFLLNAATAHTTANIAPLPLVWAVFLGAYLLSWTVGFSARGERLQPVWAVLGIAAAGACAFQGGGVRLAVWPVALRFALALALVFFGCCALHARLCWLRPGGAMLTRYNLFLAVGGAAGGILSGLVAPLAFDSVLEWPIAVVGCAALLLWDVRPWAAQAVGLYGVAAAGAAIAVGAAVGEWSARRGDLARGRSFYGAWRVYSETLRNRYGKEVEAYCFRHGGTLHGLEPVERVYREEGATAYYGPRGGGLAFACHAGYAAGRPVRAGLVGMGVGTMAWYGRKGDRFRFYEICPQVARMALDGPWFDFVRSSKADVEVRIGDARRVLEAERAAGEAKWDVLVVDAYSGDSIPVQLMTEEAFRLYRDRLAPGGVLALHLSNWHVDLVPAAKAAAAMLGMDCAVTSAPGRGFTSASTWALLSDAGVRLPEGTERIPLESVREARLPADGRGGLLPFVRIMLQEG